MEAAVNNKFGSPAGLPVDPSLYSHRLCHLEHLANFFGLDASALSQQFLDGFRTAQSLLHSGKVESSMEAWQSAIQMLRKNAARKVQSQAMASWAELQHVAARYFAFCGATTSGVEQSFAVYVDAVSDQRQNLKKDLQAGQLRMALQKPCQQVANHSVQIWSETWAAPRQCTGKKRLGRKAKARTGTEKAFLKRAKHKVLLLSGQRARRSSAAVV